MDKKDVQVRKLFSYDELFATVFLAAAHACYITVEGSFKDEKEGTRMIEQKLRETIDITWNRADKEEVIG